MQEPPAGCGLCPRLKAFRKDNAAAFPSYHNAPVPAFGGRQVGLLVVGLAPGLHGANATGRPFTGDYAGDLLYDTLIGKDFAAGAYGKTADDGLMLTDCRITNAVRCVPPQNKPTGEEIKTCNRFLKAEIATLQPRLRVIVALGKIAHDAVLRAFGHKLSAFPFEHGAQHPLDNGMILLDSYHCSRYNTNTGRLTPWMFEEVFDRARELVGTPTAEIDTAPEAPPPKPRATKGRRRAGRL